MLAFQSSAFSPSPVADSSKSRSKDSAQSVPVLAEKKPLANLSEQLKVLLSEKAELKKQLSDLQKEYKLENAKRKKNHEKIDEASKTSQQNAEKELTNKTKALDIKIDVARVNDFLNQLVSNGAAKKFMQNKQEKIVCAGPKYAFVVNWQGDGYYIENKKPGVIRKVQGVENDVQDGRDSQRVLLVPKDGGKEPSAGDCILLGNDVRMALLTSFKPSGNSIPFEVKKEGSLFGDSMAIYFRSIGDLDILFPPQGVITPAYWDSKFARKGWHPLLQNSPHK